MNAEQKKRIAHEINNWNNAAKTILCTDIGARMANILQELVDAPEPEPVARVTGYYAGYLSIATVDGRVLPAGTALYAAPPHQSEHHLEMVNTPAPSVPVEPMENIALNEWLDKTEWMQKEINTFPVSSLGMHRADVMRLEIERLRKLLSAAPTPAEAPADVARDAARLDWLDERNAPHGLGWEIIQMSAGNVHIHTLTGDKAKFESIRDAIDAAIAAEKGGA